MGCEPLFASFAAPCIFCLDAAHMANAQTTSTLALHYNIQKSDNQRVRLHKICSRLSPCCRLIENVMASSSEEEAPASDHCVGAGLGPASAVPPMSRRTEMGPLHGDGAPSPPIRAFRGPWTSAGGHGAPRYSCLSCHSILRECVFILSGCAYCCGESESPHTRVERTSTTPFHTYGAKDPAAWRILQNC